MSLKKFVNNVVDLSDDSGFKFRFHCDRCNDGVESDYIRSSTDILSTAVTVLTSFTSFGYGARTAADKVGKGLRGQERDVAYEQASAKAMVHFKKCSSCGKWVCPENCWNHSIGMCEGCAPNAHEAAAKVVNQKKVEAAIQDAKQKGANANVGLVSCPKCGNQNQGGKFCANCGESMVVTAKCGKCQAELVPGAKFCGDCGNKI